MISNNIGIYLDKLLNKIKFKPVRGPDSFKIIGVIIYNKHIIHNKINSFFTNIGCTLACYICNTGNKYYKFYLNNPSSYPFNVKTIDVDTTRNIIDRLNAKSSCRKDIISKELLKYIKTKR